MDKIIVTEMTKAVIELITALILLWLAIAPVVIKRFNKAKPNERKLIAYNGFLVAASLFAFAAMWAISKDLLLVGPAFGFMSCASITYAFCQVPEPPSRREIAFLIVTWCGCVFIVTFIPLSSMLIGIVGILDKVVTIIEKTK